MGIPVFRKCITLTRVRFKVMWKIVHVGCSKFSANSYRCQRRPVLPDDVGLVEIELGEPVCQGFAAHLLRCRQGFLYEAMNREDWNWRAWHLRIARKALQHLAVPGSVKAFVLDDTIKIRSGKKMPGVSSHFDHTTGRHVMGQQVLTLGLSCARGFVPIALTS